MATKPNGQQEASSMLADPGPSKAGATQQTATAKSSGQQAGDSAPARAASEKADAAQEAAAKMAADLLSKAKGQQEADTGPAHAGHSNEDSSQGAAASSTAEATRPVEEAKSDESGDSCSSLVFCMSVNATHSISKALSSRQSSAAGVTTPEASEIQTAAAVKPGSSTSKSKSKKKKGKKKK